MGAPVSVPIMAPNIVIFDVDGTLIDSAPGIINGYIHVLETLGIAPPSPETLAADIGPSLATIMGRYGVPDSQIPRAVELYRDRYQSVGIHEATVYPGVAELLTRLDGAGTRLATATAKRTDNATAILEAFGLTSFFEVIGSAEDPDRHSKASILTWTIAELGVAASSDIHMVGDRRFDIEGALAVGLNPLGITWGYGRRSELETAGAAEIFDTPTALADRLLTT